MKSRSEIRRRAGLSQARLAKRVGLHAPVISLWENQKRELTREQISRIERVLGEELFRWLKNIGCAA